jgi:hypothetical protein
MMYKVFEAVIASGGDRLIREARLAADYQAFDAKRVFRWQYCAKESSDCMSGERGLKRP